MSEQAPNHPWPEMTTDQISERLQQLRSQVFFGEMELRNRLGVGGPGDILWLAERRRREEQATGAAPRPLTCIGCQCDDEHACLGATGPCHWLVLDALALVGLCSECSDLMDAWRLGARTHEAAQEYRHATRHTR